MTLIRQAECKMIVLLLLLLQVRKLREENRQLAESNEEMQAASLLNRGLEQGKTLLSNYDAAPSSSMSIADELGGMSDFQVKKPFHYSFCMHDTTEEGVPSPTPPTQHNF